MYCSQNALSQFESLFLNIIRYTISIMLNELATEYVSLIAPQAITNCRIIRNISWPRDTITCIKSKSKPTLLAV